VADVFDNASVVLQSLDLRIEVVRDRGVVTCNIGPVTEPGTSYDPGLLLNYLGLSSIDGYGGPDARSVLRGVGAFTKSCSEAVCWKSPDVSCRARARVRAEC
jgi:hypothetical protein